MIATFLFASMAGKLKLIVAGSIAVLLMFATAPQTIIERYRTLFHDDVTNEATASKEGRIRLLKESIRQTFLHPVLGVGAGNFPVAYAKVREAQGILYHRTTPTRKFPVRPGSPGFSCGSERWSGVSGHCIEFIEGPPACLSTSSCRAWRWRFSSHC
jgi:hypothetical protein